MKVRSEIFGVVGELREQFSTRRRLVHMGSWRAPASHLLTVKAATLLSSAIADETSALSRPESSFQLVRPDISVEKKMIGNEWVRNMCLLTSYSAFVC